tara:strand:- start:20 stop:154 length:135 start_codon:yes stop_codon:yes gene_type:complete
VVDVAMMVRLNDQAFVGGVRLGMMAFNLLISDLVLPMGTTALVA